jgi:soluble lytic murein transglycosylase-like protein
MSARRPRGELHRRRSIRLDRRRFHRPRAALRPLLLSALTLVAPPAGKKMMMMPTIARGTSHVPARPARVTVSMDSFVLLNPAHAYDALIDEASRLYDLEPALIRAVIRAESRFNPMAVSRAGAMGLMQLMPQVAEELGVANPFEPRENIMGGARLLRRLLDYHDGNIPLMLASYNAGPRAVARYGNRVPPFRETRRYVKLITGWLRKERDVRHLRRDSQKRSGSGWLGGSNACRARRRRAKVEDDSNSDDCAR